MDTVCAVVVSYNRKELLLECLEALRKQTRPIQGIYLIDNASTDGTPGLLLEKGYIKELPPENLTDPWEKEFEVKNLTDGEVIKLYYVRMHENTGGAGGFHEGVKRSYEKGYDWLWLMDDDTIAQEEALSSIEKGICVLYAQEISFSFLCSMVFWENGIVHNMNIPSVSKDYLSLAVKVYKYGLLPVRRASFVSFVCNSSMVAEFGYPIKDFFIWNDDVEYSARLSMIAPGFLVLNSIVMHKTPYNYSSTDFDRISSNRFFYEIRNKIWIIKYSKAFTRKEKIKLFLGVVWNSYKFVVEKKFSMESIYYVFKGFVEGIWARKIDKKEKGNMQIMHNS